MLKIPRYTELTPYTLLCDFQSNDIKWIYLDSNHCSTQVRYLPDLYIFFLFWTSLYDCKFSLLGKNKTMKKQPSEDKYSYNPLP